jgi:hypothetical protein
MARIAEFVLLTRSARSARREAIAETVSAPSCTNCSNTSWSSASSSVSREVLPRNGPKYLRLSPASTPRLSYWLPDPRITLRSPSRVLASSVLKSVSRSTGALVSSAPIRPPSSSSSALFGPGLSET